MQKWLIEYVGAVPVPVYASAKPGFYTTNPWDAKRFDTKEETEAWMENPCAPRFGIPYTAPWAAIAHLFDTTSSKTSTPFELGTFLSKSSENSNNTFIPSVEVSFEPFATFLARGVLENGKLNVSSSTCPTCGRAQ